MNKVSDYLLLLVHCSVVGLHVTELMHTAMLTVSVMIGVSYMTMSVIEAVKLHKELKNLK